MADQGGLLDIAPSGDLVLHVSQDEGSRRYSFRVDSNTLQHNSRYFENLLSDRFSEGQKLSAALRALKLGGHDITTETPVHVLPRISIVNIGRIAISKTSSIQNLLADFLRVLHGADFAVANPPLANLANLGVVADRFDAVPCLSKHVQKKKYLHVVDAKSKGKANPALTEERARQKLLTGILFDHAPWVTKYSKYLIIRDSVQWQPGAEEDHTKALWWNIPNGVEDELIKRRECILDSINSLQAHFLKLYTSGERQCKLGYDTSLQCDSFQLGEMIRFFHKIDTIRLQGKIYDNQEPVYYVGDIERLVASLRQCSNYQVDGNHGHCGLRSRMLPLLDLLQNQLSLDTGGIDIAICADCWNKRRSEYAWDLAKRPVFWGLPRSFATGRTLTNGSYQKGYPQTPGSCLARHTLVRDMFMAVEKEWTREA